MKKNNKKGFTIVELVVVIAVIGILAAVLIPTFSNIIEKANISADTQLCRNMNTALSTAKADGREFNNMEDVLFTINEAGYVIENLNPTTEGYYYAWDSENDQIVFLNKKLNVHYPTDAKIDPAECWVTVKTNTEANKVANHGYALYIEPNAKDDFAIGNLVSVDGGANTGLDLTIGETNASGSIEVRGNFNNLQISAPNAHVEQYGVANEVTAEVSDNTFVVNGFVKTLNVTSGKVEVKETGVVKALTGTIKGETKGIVENHNGNPVTNTGKTVSINNRAELESFRDTVNGGFNYAGMTVKLNADIDLNGIAWLPIGNFYRKLEDGKTANTVNGFAGTFDGNGKTIKNLSNNGFSVTGLAVGSNSTTPEGYTEVVYGLFGTVIGGAEIKNLTVNADIDVLKFGKVLGDSVGAIAGNAAGDVQFTNCTVTGVVKGYDCVAAILGRRTAGVILFTNCVNNAQVSGQRKTAGICGWTTKDTTFSGCSSTGVVTCLGKATDVAEAGAGYYVSNDIVNGSNYVIA